MKQFNEAYIYDIYARSARYELNEKELNELVCWLDDTPSKFQDIQDYSAIVLLNTIDTKLMTVFVTKFFSAAKGLDQQFEYLKAHCEHKSFTRVHLQKFFKCFATEKAAFESFLERLSQFDLSSMSVIALSKLYGVDNQELRSVLCETIHPFYMFNAPQITTEVKDGFMAKLSSALTDDVSVSLFDKPSHSDLIRNILSFPELAELFQQYCSQHHAVCKRVFAYYKARKDNAAKKLLKTMHPYDVLNIAMVDSEFLADFEEQLHDAFSYDNAESLSLFLSRTRKILIHNILRSDAAMITVSFAEFCGSHDAVFKLVLEEFMGSTQEEVKDRFLQFFTALFGVVSFEKACDLEHIIKMLDSGDIAFRMLLLKEKTVFNRLFIAEYEFTPDDQDLILQLIGDNHLQFLFDDVERYKNTLAMLKARLKVLVTSDVELVQSVYVHALDRRALFCDFSVADYSALLQSSDVLLVEKFFNNAKSEAFDLQSILRTAMIKITRPAFYKVLLSEEYKECIIEVFKDVQPRVFCSVFKPRAFHDPDLCEALVKFSYFVGLETMIPNEQTCTLELLKENAVLREIIFKTASFSRLKSWYAYKTGDDVDEEREIRTMSEPSKGARSRREFIYLGAPMVLQPQNDESANLAPPPPPPGPDAQSMEDFFKNKPKYNPDGAKPKPKYKKSNQPERPPMSMEEILAIAKAKREANAAKMSAEEGKTGLTPQKKTKTPKKNFAMFANLKTAPTPESDEEDDDDKNDFTV